MNSSPVLRNRNRILQNDAYSVKLYQRFFTGSSGRTNTYVSSGVKTEYESMTDYVVPRYKSRSARGEIFNNNLTKVYVKDVDEIASFSAKHTNLVLYDGKLVEQGDESWGSFASSRILRTVSNPQQITGLGIDIDSMVQLAVTRAFANIDFSAANLLETAAEARETVSFATDTLKRAVRIFRAARKLDWRYLKKEIKLKELRDRYMELRYGLRPLIYDARNISKTLLAQERKLDRFTFRGYESKTVSAPNSNDTIRPSFLGSTWIKRSLTASRTVSVRAGVLTQIDLDHPPSSWGIDQPIEAIWEIIPFSFIADWFFNIGDTIASWTPNVGVDTKASWVTVDNSVVCEDVVTDSWSAVTSGYSTNFCTVTGCSHSREYRTRTRTANPRRAIIPTIKVNLDVLKLIDLAIILKTLKDSNVRKRLRI